MNSFQTWAIRELFAVNIHAQPLGNWVEYKSDVTGLLVAGTLMSEEGVNDLVAKARVGGAVKTTKKLKDVKKGGLIKLLKGSKAVYVRGDYVRELKKYSLTRWDDINAERWVKGDTLVEVDFEF